MKLNEEIKERIKQEPALYGGVCDALGNAPASLPAILKRDDSRLLQINVLNVIKQLTGLTETEILDDKVTA
jgi:hypothetical protein